MFPLDSPLRAVLARARGPFGPLQEMGAIEVQIDLVTGVLGGTVGAFFTTLVVGAILVAVAPEYTERMIDSIVEDPFGTFVYGMVCLVFVLLSTFVLVLTVIGILVAVPFLLVVYVVWAVGAAVAYLAIADGLVGHRDGWLKPLLVAAGINAGLTLTVLGGLLSLAIGAAGFGVVLRDYIE